MNEKSVWNNMVGTNYGERFNIEIVSDPEVTRRCSLQKEESSKFKTLLGKGLTIGGILLALGGAVAGMAYITNAQEQSRIENTQVVQIVNLPDGATLNVTENPSYSYIETSDGKKVAEYNGINARDYAQDYVDSQNAKQK